MTEQTRKITGLHRLSTNLCAHRILLTDAAATDWSAVHPTSIEPLRDEWDATCEMNEYKVPPEQFLGLELSPNAVAIAQLVLWIGYFQWQRKTAGKADIGDRPLLPKTQTNLPPSLSSITKIPAAPSGHRRIIFSEIRRSSEPPA